MNSAPAHANRARTSVDLALERVRDALSGLEFGSVLVTVHDGRVVQIEVTEKTRVPAQ